MNKQLLSELVASSDISAKKIKAVLDHYDEKIGLSGLFWNALRQDPRLGPEIADEIQFTLKLGESTMYHVPLLHELQQLRKDKVVMQVQDLLELDWMSLIMKRVKGKRIGTPPDVPGGTEDEKVRNYAEALSVRVPRLFPSAVIARQVETILKEPKVLRAAKAQIGPMKGKNRPTKEKPATKIERLNRFFQQNPRFDLSSTPISKRDEDIQEDLMSLRRLLKIGPPDSTMDVYMDGLNSAHQVARMGRANFLAQYGPKLGHESKRIHVKAINQSMMALNLFARHSPTFNSVGLAALPSQTASVPEIPEWTSLFGTLNICDILDDRSVFSLAAYLVDVLHFLDQQKLRSASGKEKGEKRALEVLLERRPDLAWLELSGINTFTTLPYVDLVNEVLEAAVFPLQFSIKAGFEKELDNREISPELKEEFTNNGYELSNNARVLVKEEEKGFKWHIRDGSWIFEINLGYGGLDVAVSAVYQTGATPNELAANPEYLDARAYDILAQQIYPWNLPFDLWAEAARVYLTHLGIPRYKLMELFHTEKTRAISVATEYLGLSGKEREIITGTDKENKPWQYWGLDEKDNPISTKNGTDKLYWTEALQRVPVFLERSGMSYEHLLDLLATMFINPEGSIEVQFPTPASEEESTITSSCDIERAVIATTEPDDTFNKIHRFMRWQRKTSWSIQEFDKVIRVLAWQDLDDDVIIATRYLRQLQAEMRVPLNELLSWYAKIDTARGAKGEPSFYEQLFLNRTVLRPVDEKFKLNKDRDDLAVNSDPEKNKETLKGHVSTLHAALKISDAELDFVIAAEFPGKKDAPLNRENLSRVHRVVSLSRALKLSIEDFYALKAMCGIDPFNRNDITATLRFLETLRLVQGSGFGFPELDYLVRTIERPQASLTPTETEIGQVLAEIRDGLKKIADERVSELESGDDQKDRKRASSESYVKQKLSNTLKLESEVINDLLTKWLSDAKTLETFIDPKFVNSDQKISMTADHFPEQFSIYRLLHRISLLVIKFKITPLQLEWLFNNGPKKPGYMQLKEPAELFDHWERLVYLFRLRDQLGEETLSKFFGKREINKSSVLSENDFRSLKENGFIPENYWDKDRLKRLPDCLAALKRLGIGAEEVLQWCESDLPSRDARESARNIKRAVKAKYDEQQWLEIARPLEDVLREKRRVALLSYHMARERLRDTHNLYQHFLLDVEMSPCMMTSRTKLAISSVQLFVQRCLMNLEEWRIPSPEQALEWKHLWEWMKNYRVWEANRKIFLYPENWIEPELRRNKSPFFKDLENELLMGEMTAELAESAFLNYLQKLNEVARLEICGLYHEKETNAPKGRGETTVSVLHVFAHTRGMPRVYYYRRRADGAWTAWERVEVDIEGDHLIPVVFNRRLYLFWPIITEKTEVLKDKEGKDIKDAQGKQKTWESWEMQLAFSEYRAGRWSAKKISDEKLAINPAPKDDKATEEFKKLGSSEKKPREPSEKKDFTFKTFIENEVLQILCALRNPGHDPVSYSYRSGFRFMSDAQIDTLSEGKREYVNLAYPISSPATGCHYENMVVKLDSDKLGLSLLANKSERKILAESPSSFTLIFPHQLPQKDWQDCFFYQDTERVFFVERKPTSESRAVRQAGESPEQLGLPAYESVEAPLSEPSFPWEYSPVSASSSTLQVGAGEEDTYYFEIAYHPLVHEFTKHLNRDGVDGLLRRPVQQMRRESLLFRLSKVESGWFEKEDEKEIQRVFREHGITFSANFKLQKINDLIWEISGDKQDGTKNWTCYVEREPDGLLVYRDFKQQYAPTTVVAEPYPSGITDFDAGGFYAQCNWELFFHAPLMIADRLSKNQRFEEAQKWFHHIFDPTDTSGHAAPQRYWKVLPFFEEARGKPIQELMALLRYKGTNKEMQEAKRKLEKQLEHWKQDPFEPHLIAQLRPGAYQKTVVMKYIDNLIAWGDQLFRRDTIESINEATQLYILAAEIQGKRPVIIPPPWDVPSQAFEQMREYLDVFSNGPIQLEEVLPEVSVTTLTKGTGIEVALGISLYLACVTEVSGGVQIPYFGIPRNDKLLSCWDTVADRLFKIRHCMTIEGVERQLPLFEPPIEPGLLVRAAAAGVDISSALRDLEVSMPQYRFGVVLQKAINLCNDVRALGSAFLSVLEKRDAEGLAKLRMGQKEVDLRRWIKQEQIKEAEEMLTSLEKAKQIAEARKEHGEKELEMTNWEKAHLGLLIAQKSTLFGASIAQIIASKVALIPDAYAGTAGIASPLTFSKVAGGEKVSKTADHWAKGLEYTSKVLAAAVEGAKLMAQHQRKKEEWKHQKDVISKEIEQLDCQIEAAKIRVAITQKELENFKREVDNAKEVDTYMRDRFTNLELYNWMVSQLSALYFQSYQMAYDLAKRAEKVFHYELGQDDTTYIRFGYWDSLKKGLLASEKLYYDLRRMEAAYLEHHKRNYEITKHISLATYFPEQLNQLREKGECFVDLPEMLFDLDYPGHYLRRIKSVSLSINGEVKPYTSVNCTLTLAKSEVRMNASLAGDNKYERQDRDDPRFKDMVGVVQSIATSSAQDDSGLFELNFHDERYLPFEGAGAISQWHIELPHECNQIDVEAISDVVLHMQFSARDGGERLRGKAKEAVADKLSEYPLGRLIDVKQEFAQAWNDFVKPADDKSVLNLPLKPSLFPALFRGREIQISAAWLFVALKDKSDTKEEFAVPFTLNTARSQHENEFKAKAGSGLLYAEFRNLNEPLGTWHMTVGKDNAAQLQSVENMLILISYKVARRSERV